MSALTAESTLRTWRVSVTGPGGTGVMDVPSFSADAAKRRAYWTAAHLRWGDLDELEVTACEEVCQTCQGAGELTECANDGTHGCSHINDRAWSCTDCHGEGTVPTPVTA